MSRMLFTGPHSILGGSHKRRCGFSSMELLLVVAILAMLGGLSMPLYLSFQAKNDLDLATDVVAQTLRRAQTFSRAMSGDDPWGVYVEDGSATLFKGASYASRDGSYDEVSYLADSVIVAGGPVEVAFGKLSGELAAPVVITLTSRSVSNTSIITINQKGMISF